MDPREANGVFVDEADAEEVVTLDNEDEMEVDDSASWVTESEGAASLEDLEDDDDEDGTEIDPEKDDAVTTFQRHTGEVYCVRINATNNLLAVTGGKDDRAFVWNVNNGEVLFECTGHSDSVVSVDFNCSGTLLATGDMNGVVIIWKVENGEKMHEVQASEIQWLKWHPVGNVLMAGTGSSDEANGDIVLWEFPSCSEKYLLGPGLSRCNTGNFFPDGKQAVAGYDSGMVRIWGLKNGDCVQKFRAHSGPVTRLECHHENKILLSASVDGTVCLLHAVNGQILKKYEIEPVPGTVNSSDETIGVNAAAFCPSIDFKFLAMGMESGLLIIWDYATHVRRAQCHHTAEIEQLLWDPKGPFVYTCTADAKVCLWDARNGQQVGCWTGHRKGIFDMDLSRDGKFLVTVSYDKTARVFSVETPSPKIVASRIPLQQ